MHTPSPSHAVSPPNSVFLQCFLSTDYGLARRLSSPYRPIISVTFINQFWPSMDVQIISTCCVCRQTLPVGVQIKTVWGFWPEEGERMSLLSWWRPQYCHRQTLFLFVNTCMHHYQVPDYCAIEGSGRHVRPNHCDSWLPESSHSTSCLAVHMDFTIMRAHTSMSVFFGRECCCRE